MIENFWIVDPTLRLKESEKEQFIVGNINSGVCIFDIEKVPDNIEYIPMLIGMELLAATNQINFSNKP